MVEELHLLARCHTISQLSAFDKRPIFGVYPNANALEIIEGKFEVELCYRIIG
jgi:hypothetical protein